ncbi:serine/threonine protein kinase, partial [Streptomyces sp. NPDC005877]
VGTGDDDGTRQQAVGSASGASPSASGAQDGTGGVWDGGGPGAASPGPAGGHGRASASPGTRPAKDAKDGKDGKRPGEKGGATPGRTPAGGHASATPGGAGGTSGGGTGSTPAPSCHPAGAGKSDCQVWRTAKSYRQDGGEAGVLNAGTNYFYCQTDLGRRETYGKWTNTYWARTDDDSGNTNVYVSVVYLKGGANNAPVPGLPVC